jgi:hypothetical protein
MPTLTAFAGFFRSRLVSGRERESRAVWKQELARLTQHLHSLASDFERTIFLREYTGSLLPIGRPDANSGSHASSSFESLDLAKMYPLFKGHILPAECGTTSLFYVKLLHDFGFKAYQYSFGFTEKPYAQFIHSTGLVEIDYEGDRRLILQDPYLNLTYRESDGSRSTSSTFWPRSKTANMTGL